jgi:DNA replication protein DnaC
MSEPAKQQEPTAEQLLAKVEELRRQRRDSTPTASAGLTEEPTFQPVSVMAKCEKCGEGFTSMTFTGTAIRQRVCRRCVDREAAEQAEERQRADAEGLRAEAKAREDAIPRLLADAGANPREHGRATLENFDATAAGDMPVQYARRFVSETLAAGPYDPVKGLYLYGGTGTGKTHLAVAVLRALMLDPKWNPRDVLYDHASHLMAQIQATYGGNGDTMAVLERRFKAPVWILDDMGTERATSDVAQHLTLIFTMRAMTPTLVTSNLSPRELEESRPELVRVISRLGHGYFRHAEVKGHDRRFD